LQQLQTKFKYGTSLAGNVTKGVFLFSFPAHYSFTSIPLTNVTVTPLTSLSFSITNLIHLNLQHNFYTQSNQISQNHYKDSSFLNFLIHSFIHSVTMALRLIDNALPTITQERPKKQPKIAVSTQKQQQPRTSSNDENQVPLEPTIDYISSDNLKPMSDPEAQIQVSIKNSIFLFPLKKNYSFFGIEFWNS
jgi:hypothetical protein